MRGGYAGRKRKEERRKRREEKRREERRGEMDGEWTVSGWEVAESTVICRNGQDANVEGCLRKRERERQAQVSGDGAKRWWVQSLCQSINCSVEVLLVEWRVEMGVE